MPRGGTQFRTNKGMSFPLVRSNEDRAVELERRIKQLEYQMRTHGHTGTDTSKRLLNATIQLRNIDTGGDEVVVYPGDNLQFAIDRVNSNGGGRVLMRNGTYYLNSTVMIRSNVALVGLGAITTLDFSSASAKLSGNGTDTYTTGTVEVTNGSPTVTGTLTVWTTAMEGRQMLIGDYWYEILTVNTGTSITLASNYIGDTATSLSYVMANPIENIHLEHMTIQNSAATEAVDIRYAADSRFSAVSFFDNQIGVRLRDGSFTILTDCYFEGNTTSLDDNNYHFGTSINTSYNASTGNGFVMNTARNWAVVSFSIESCGGDGINLTSCSNNGFENFSIKNNAGQGVELVSGNSSNILQNGNVASNGSDGVKLTATSDKTIMNALNFTSNGGYGVNVAAATCDDNVIVANTFATNVSGAINDSGTNTVISSNAGV